MGLADLPDGFVTFDRDEIIRRHKRDNLLRNPEADVTSGQPDMDAKLDADLVVPLYSDASIIADGINESDATGPRLDRVGERYGVRRGKARGAVGYVRVEGVGTVQATVHTLQNVQTKILYEIAETRPVTNGQHVRVRARNTGPATDLDAGVVLSFTNPPPGIGQHATVVEQSGGRGLTGGADTESDARYSARIEAHKQSPPAGDNDSELVDTILSTPDVPFEQAFTIRGIYGPGTCGIVCTVLAPEVGASRIPTDAQMQSAFEWLRSQMPGDHSYFPLVQTSEGLSLSFRISWATGGWADVAPWPAQYADHFVVSGATSALSFEVDGSGIAPVVGSMFATWDRTKRIFRRKRVLTVTGSGPYAVTCDEQLGASDATYTPAIGQRLSPWSDNLSALPSSVLAYLSTLGPGEVFDPNEMPSEDGRGRIRQPRAPKYWPYQTTNKVTNDISALSVVLDVAALAGIGAAPSPSMPPAQLELVDLAFFKA